MPDYLVSIEERNKAMEFIRRTVLFTGVACPECGEELHYKGNAFLATYPPQREVVCPSCGWKGSVLA